MTAKPQNADARKTAMSRQRKKRNAGNVTMPRTAKKSGKDAENDTMKITMPSLRIWRSIGKNENYYGKRRRELAIKTDCISYDKHGGCGALQEIVCAKRKCPFYKNQTMLDEQTERVRKRIPDYDPKRGGVH